MRNFKLISSILSDHWLIHPDWAARNAPLVEKLLKGDLTDAEGMELSGQEENPEKFEFEQTQAGVLVPVAYNDLSGAPDGSIGIIDIFGPITKYGGMCSYGTNDYTNWIKRAENHPNIKGIIIRLDTPGGQANGTVGFAQAIRECKKPVIAYVDDGMACSAGMWIASQANEVWASQKTDIIGSIGAFIQLPDYVKYFESQGLKVHTIYSRLSQDKNKEYHDAMDGNYEGMQNSLDALVKEFIGTVKKGRAGKISSNDPFTGKTYRAPEALKVGLIDKIGSLEDAAKRINTISRSGSSKSKISTNQNIMDIKTIKAWLNGHKENAADPSDREAAEHITQVMDDNKRLQEQNEDLQEDLNTANAEKDTAEAKITELEGKISALESTIQERDTSITEKDNKISELEGTIKEKDTKIEELGKKPGAEIDAPAGKKGDEQSGKKTSKTTSEISAGYEHVSGILDDLYGEESEK
jgi:signal peptide peptidase SppA